MPPADNSTSARAVKAKPCRVLPLVAALTALSCSCWFGISDGEGSATSRSGSESWIFYNCGWGNFTLSGWVIFRLSLRLHPLHVKTQKNQIIQDEIGIMTEYHCPVALSSIWNATLIKRKQDFTEPRMKSNSPIQFALLSAVAMIFTNLYSLSPSFLIRCHAPHGKCHVVLKMKSDRDHRSPHSVQGSEAYG